MAFAAILMVESGSIAATEKARRMNVVAMLAKNAMIDAELNFQGKTFSEIKTEEKGVFPKPFEMYRWTRKVNEVEFPSLSSGMNSAVNESTSDDQTDMVNKVITNFLSKALREVTVTVEWERGEGVQSQTITQYWVDLNHELSLTP